MVLSCTGSRKYFKAAAKLEKQGLVNEAAEYYFESLQRSPSNTDARIKLKEVGQKYVSNLSSEFFRNYNTQQLEPSLETFERLKNFHGRAASLNVQLDYPRSYEDDYQKAVENYCSINYNKAFAFVNQRKYYEALPFIKKVQKYNGNYRNLQQLDVIATCEPLYQSAISNLENKNYNGALNLLSQIKGKSETYKDAQDLLELASAQEKKSMILFPPKAGGNPTEKDIEEFLFNNFNQSAMQKLPNIQVINNTPFQLSSSKIDMSNSENVDLTEAIRKATGADFFYSFDVSDVREYNSGLQKTTARGYQEFRTKRKDQPDLVEYRSFDYNNVKSQRTYSFEFKYRLINAYTNQIQGSSAQVLRSQDAVEYQEFHRAYTGNINDLFPYNPQQTSPMAQYNARNWRALFSARSALRSFDELKIEALNKSVDQFLNSCRNLR